MATSKSSAEVKQDRIDIMGYDLGLLYDIIYNDIFWLQSKWLEYLELYGTKKSRIELLNKSAPFFFFMVQRVLWDNILLSLAKLIDPIKTGKNRNVTILALPEYINDELIKSEVKKVNEEILLSTKFCRDWRNKLISHRDYEIAISNKVKILPKAYKDSVSQSLTGFFKLINIIERHYFNAEVRVELFKNDLGSFKLLHVLRDGLEYREEYFKRLESGTFTSKDLKRTDI